jgi:hypothetical protein
VADILDLVGSAASGGIVGVFGSIIGRGLNIWESKEKRKDRLLEMAHEEKAWTHEGQLLSLQSQLKQQETEQTIKATEIQGSWAALAASQEAESSIGDSYRWVNAVRGLTRPGITLLLWLIVIVVMMWMRGEAMRLADATLQDKYLTMIKGLVDSIIFAATTATVWWFGDRAPRAKT